MALPTPPAFCLATLTGHTQAINALEIANGSLYSVGDDAKLISWNCASGTLLKQMAGHSQKISSLAAMDGHLYTGSSDSIVRCFKPSTGACAATMSSHTEAVTCMAVSGSVLFTGSLDRRIKAWSGNRCVATLSGHSKPIRKLAVHNNLLFSASDDTSIKVWNVSNYMLVKSLSGHAEPVNCMIFDGPLIYTGSNDRFIKCWHIDSGSCVRTFTGHTGAVHCLASVGNVLYSGAEDGLIKAWSKENGSCLRTLKGHVKGVTHLCVVPGARGGRGIVFSASKDASVRAWCPDSGACIAVYSGHLSAISSMIFDREGGLLITGSHDGKIKFWTTDLPDEPISVSAAPAGSLPSSRGSTRDFGMGMASASSSRPISAAVPPPSASGMRIDLSGVSRYETTAQSMSAQSRPISGRAAPPFSSSSSQHPTPAPFVAPSSAALQYQPLSGRSAVPARQEYQQPQSARNIYNPPASSSSSSSSSYRQPPQVLSLDPSPSSSSSSSSSFYGLESHSQSSSRPVSAASTMELEREFKRLEVEQVEMQRLHKEREELLSRRETAFLEREKQLSAREAMLADSSKKTVQIMRYGDLRSATNGFAPKQRLGGGGFGDVFAGTLPSSGTEIAVKKLDRARSQQGDAEFLTEVSVLGGFSHPNILPLIGISVDGDHRCLVYPLCKNGSLFRCLHDPTRKALSWRQRASIIIDCARGLLFLHTPSGSKGSVVHRDIKSDNLLLDSSFVAKLGDVGVAKEMQNGPPSPDGKSATQAAAAAAAARFLPGRGPGSRPPSSYSSSSSSAATRIMGTQGYVDPEYLRSGVLEPASDMYSFGVLMLETLTGLPAFSPQDPIPDLAKRLRPALMDPNRVLKCADAKAGEWPAELVKTIVMVALNFTHPNRRDRDLSLVRAIKFLEDGLRRAEEQAESAPDVATPPPAQPQQQPQQQPAQYQRPAQQAAANAAAFISSRPNSARVPPNIFSHYR